MDHLTEKIDGLFAENKGSEAESLLEQALKEAYEKQDFATAVPILNELIGYCRETSQVERSYAYAQEVKEILQKLGMEGTIPYATTLLNIANAYRAGGRLEDSLQTYDEVTEIYLGCLEADDMLWASLFNNISLLYQEMNNHELAKECLLRAQAIVENKPDTVFEQAVTYTNLAASCLQLGQGEEAEAYFTEAIRLFEENHIRDSHYCAALASLATYLYQHGKYEEAAENFRKAMEGMEESLGRNEYYYRLEENYHICSKAAEEQKATRAAGAKAQKSHASVQEDTNQIKGLRLCREYYEAYGRPMIEQQFATYTDRIAVGLAGEGSDCFGYDDIFSRDHDWGPGFYMWVDDEIYEQIGEALQKAYEELPKEFKGYVYKESAQGRGRRGVWRINDFFKYLLGDGAVVPQGAEWTAQNIRYEEIDECRLAAAVNGEVFRDEQGTFSGIRRLLTEAYPRTLRYLRMAEAAARFSQNGQYNYERMYKRGDRVTAGLMLSDCIREAMKLLYYVAEKFPPHDKWLFQGLADIEEYQDIRPLLEEVLNAPQENVAAVVEELAAQLAYLLYRKDYISDVNPFLQEHTPELRFKALTAEYGTEELSERIAALEFKAFDKVKNLGGRADCQDDWFTFSIMRKSQYMTWNRVMLLQYYYDFSREYNKGHNLIEEKYGRMMESTAPEEYRQISAGFPVLTAQKKQIIENIVAVQVGWMEAFAAEYPLLAGNARSIHTYEDHLYNTSYETYLRGELGTYSDKMLELYGRYIVEYARAGRNVARDIMEQSVWMYGYESLEEAEKGLEKI